MPRNNGSIVDVTKQSVRERDGVWYPLERLILDGRALYYARPVDGNDHFVYQQRWLLSDQAWSVSRFTFHEDFKDRVDWYIEMDMVEVDGHEWRVRDGYLDVAVWEGQRYEVWDADELAEGLEEGAISLAEAVTALQALNRVTLWLKRNGFSGAALLREFGRNLPDA